MFDATAGVDMTLPSPAGFKSATVSYPADEQLIARAAALKTIVRNLGRGKSMTEPAANSEQVDFDLYQKIRQDGSPDLDPYEAQRLMQHLLRVEVLDSRREGTQFHVELDTPAGTTSFLMSMPSAKQVIDYRRSVVQVIDNRRTQEIRMNLRASRELFDSLHVSHDGYAGEVPVNHAAAVISELLALLETEDDDTEIRSFRR